MKLIAEKSKQVRYEKEIITPQSIVLSDEEYENLKRIFCECKGWKYEVNDNTVNIREITIHGNYKWHPGYSFTLKITGEETD